MTTYKLFPEKMGATNVEDFIGQYGEIFYDCDVGALRRSDGVTPGGIPLPTEGGSSTGYAGVFYDTTLQTNSAQVNKVKCNTTDISDGISIVDNTKITMANTGRYNIQFSLQMDKTDSGTDEFELWLMKNGVNVDNTNTKITSTGNNDKFVAAWNFVVNAASGDYFELAWYSADAEMRIFYTAPASNPTRPAIPSAIITVTQV